MKKELGLFVLLLGLCVFVALVNPRFRSPGNLQDLCRLAGIFGIFSIGLGFVIITGGIDLSPGSAMALQGVILSILIKDSRWSPAVAIVVVLMIGAGLGVGHGLLITRARMQPFIVTLCGLLLYRGLARYVADDNVRNFTQVPVFDAWKQALTSPILGVPVPFWIWMAVSAVAWVVLYRSVYGRQLFAVGSNEQAARYAGIDTNRVILIAYIICGVLTALSGVLFAFYTESVLPSQHANFYELYGIAAAVLGGCSLRGGEGSLAGIVLGVFLLRVLQNAQIFLRIKDSLEFVVVGAVILIGLLIDQIFKNRATRA